MKLIIMFCTIALVTGIAASCGGSSSSPTPQAPTATPAPTTKLVRAPVDDAEIIVPTSDRPQYSVHIVSGLPSGCHRFASATVSRDGTTIHIDVENTAPADPKIACTAIYGYHESSVDLGTDLQTGTTYTVEINGRMLTLTAGGVR